MGVAGGFVMVVFFSFWGKAYGRTHLGRIQGVAQALTVFASAIGPLLLAWCVDATGSYAAAFYALAAVLTALALAAMVVPVPAGAEAIAALIPLGGPEGPPYGNLKRALTHTRAGAPGAKNVACRTGNSPSTAGNGRAMNAPVSVNPIGPSCAAV